MTPAVSGILIVLAIVGATSIGVWANQAVSYFTTRNNLTAHQVENSLLRERLAELTERNGILGEDIYSLRNQLDETQNKIVTKLLG